jgi:accessory gene regulator B
MHTLIIDYIYGKISSQEDLGKDEQAMIRYSLEVVVNTFIKLLMVYIAFLLIGKSMEFLYILVCVVGLRSFSGGLHFESFSGCVGFTLLYFLGTLTLSILLPTTDWLIYITCLIAFTITLLFAPVISPKRPKYPIKKIRRFKIVSLIFIIIYLGAYMVIGKHAFFEVTVWGLIIHIVQLFIGKGVNYHVEKKTIHNLQ